MLKLRYDRLRNSTSISIEELDETLFWLEILANANLIRKDKNFASLQQEALETLKIFSSYVKNMKFSK